jgi:membrane-bound ClpP family serine protease
MSLLAEHFIPFVAVCIIIGVILVLTFIYIVSNATLESRIMKRGIVVTATFMSATLVVNTKNQSPTFSKIRVMFKHNEREYVTDLLRLFTPHQVDIIRSAQRFKVLCLGGKATLSNAMMKDLNGGQ